MFIVVDDEQFGGNNTKDAILECEKGKEVVVFNTPMKALEFANGSEIECAFLDISMPGMSGIELAKKIKMAQPNCNIIFTTGFDNFYGDAFAIGASDYLLKPITGEKIKRALGNLRNPISEEKGGLVIQCFGDFEVFYNGKNVYFSREKAKEMLAYLVYRNGAAVTKGEIMANLWEDDNDSYYGVVKKNLIDTLNDLGATDVIVNQWKTLAVNKNAVSCDFYDFQAGKPSAINKFLGEFMSQYSWSEDVESILCKN